MTWSLQSKSERWSCDLFRLTLHIRWIMAAITPRGSHLLPSPAGLSAAAESSVAILIGPNPAAASLLVEGAAAGSATGDADG